MLSESKMEEEWDAQAAFKEIVDYLETTDLDYVQIEKGAHKIVIRRPSQSLGISSRASGVVPNELEEPKEAKAQENTGQTVHSPIVGRFYISTGPDRPPFILESGRVTAGQRVAIVEAMKIKKEVFSPYTGTVVRIHVRNGDPVEYGQVLFTVEPDQKKRE
jgi:biotin carboxyl carrier protein